ncbi:hypothetical protein JKP88DRAFT_263199 [Tribonema minus]|uniref:Dynein axonemal intermediate chain 4 n=1 Tax=Tribonema minus TaxID=303371 RepID=A0A835YZL2_9STRA|nr:hypothetical protein JKP88DRAFT_263199 [Tribonema minus]
MASKTSVSRMRQRPGGGARNAGSTANAFSGTGGSGGGGGSRSRSAYASGMTTGFAGGAGGMRVMLDGRNVTPQTAAALRSTTCHGHRRLRRRRQRRLPHVSLAQRSAADVVALLRNVCHLRGRPAAITALSSIAVPKAQQRMRPLRARMSGRSARPRLTTTVLRSRICRSAHERPPRASSAGGAAAAMYAMSPKSKPAKARAKREAKRRREILLRELGHDMCKHMAHAQAGEGGALTEDKLAAPVTLLLQETPTIMLLEIRGSAVATDFRDYDKYQREKQEYDRRVAAKQGSETAQERHTQTLNWPPKHKEAMAVPAPTKDAAASVLPWEIYDAAATQLSIAVLPWEIYAACHAGGALASVGVSAQVADMVARALAAPGCLLETEHTVAPPPLPQHSSGGGDGGGSGGGGGHSSALRVSGGVHSGGGGSGSGAHVGGVKSKTLAAAPAKPAPSQRRRSSNNTSGTGTHTSGGAAAGDAANASSTDHNGGGGPGVMDDDDSSPEAAAALLAKHRAQKLLTSPQLLAALELVERSLFQNAFLDKQLQYRNLPPLDEPPAPSRPSSPTPLDASVSVGGSSTRGEGGEGRGAQLSLEKLWTHLFPASALEARGGPPVARAVTALSFQNQNQDLLAAGYGALTCTAAGDTRAAAAAADRPARANMLQTLGANGAQDQSGASSLLQRTAPAPAQAGCILFWSVRNPGWPERIIRTPSGVTCLAFSDRHPNLLAIGLYSGAIAVYDIARDRGHGGGGNSGSDGHDGGGDGSGYGTPIAESSTSAGKHNEPVWQVKWVGKGAERGDAEVLVSISTDGRVCEWSIKKGCVHAPLMVLRRVGAAEGVISRQASGLALDFPPRDSTHYLVGTEDGLIHKCSVSYSEQYLETYSGHTGPVYRIRCSPFCDKLFLSCSADWTVKLWDQRAPQCLKNLRSADLFAAVNDVCWSPTSSTLLASAADNGRLELWDLAQSVIDPAVRVTVRAEPPAAGGGGASASQDGTDAPETTSPRGGADSASDAEDDDIFGLDAAAAGATAAGAGAATAAQTRPPTNRSRRTAPSSAPSRGGRGGAAAAAAAAAATGSLSADAPGSPAAALLPGLSLTSVAFAAAAPVVAAGDAAGGITVFKIGGVAAAAAGCDFAEQARRLLAAARGGDAAAAAAAAAAGSDGGASVGSGGGGGGVGSAAQSPQ